MDWLVSLAALIISQPIGFVKMAVVFVTNIATECAQAISSELLARGYSVHCGITKSCEALVSNFPKISFHEFDPDDPDTMEVVATRVLRHSESIDGVISMPERGVFGSIEETSAGDVSALFNRHIFNTSILMQAFLPVVRSNQRGSFIFVGRKFSLTYAGMTGWMRACNAAQAEVMQALKDEFAEINVRVSLMETQLDAECFDAVNRILNDTSGHSTYYRNMIEEQRRGLADTHEGALGCQNFAIDVCNELPLPETDMRPPPPSELIDKPAERTRDLVDAFRKLRLL